MGALVSATAAVEQELPRHVPNSVETSRWDHRAVIADMDFDELRRQRQKLLEDAIAAVEVSPAREAMFIRGLLELGFTDKVLVS